MADHLREVPAPALGFGLDLVKQLLAEGYLDAHAIVTMFALWLAVSSNLPDVYHCIAEELISKAVSALRVWIT